MKNLNNSKLNNDNDILNTLKSHLNYLNEIKNHKILSNIYHILNNILKVKYHLSIHKKDKHSLRGIIAMYNNLYKQLKYFKNHNKHKIDFDKLNVDQTINYILKFNIVSLNKILQKV